MTKIHLVARVPNEGARLTAQWILQQPDGAFDRLAAKIGTGVIGLSRILAGEVLPGEQLGFLIYSATRCSVDTRDFWRPAKGGWFDVAEAQPARRAA